MVSLLRAINECLFGADHHEVFIASEENVMAANILRTLFSADEGGEDLKKRVQDVVGVRGWTENIAKAVLGGIENGLKQGAQMGKAMKEASVDTIMLIPPAHQDKVNLTLEMREAAMKAEIPNVLFLSAAGCDLAEREKQPRLREFIDLETKVMETKGMTETNTGHSPCIIRYTRLSIRYGSC